MLLILAINVSANINSIGINFSNYGTYGFVSDYNYYMYDNFAGNDANGWGTFSNISVTNDRLEVTNTLNGATASKNFTDFNSMRLEFGYTGSIGTGDPSAYIQISATSGLGGYALRITKSSPSLNYKLLRDSTILLDINSNSDVNIFATRNQSGLFKLYNSTGLLGSVTDTTYISFETADALFDETSTSGGTTYFDNIKLLVPKDTNNFYVNQLDYNISYNCSSVDANAVFQVNDTNIESYQFVCDNLDKNISDSYTHPTEGLFNVKVFYWDSNTLLTNLLNSTSFISDLNNPIIDINFGSFSTGFGTSLSDLNVHQVCFDNISPSVHYDLNNETSSTNLLNAYYDANSTQKVSSGSTSGINNFVGECVDLAGNNASDTNSITISSVCFSLVNEENGTAFTTTDINNNFTAFRAIAYSTGDTFDFMSPLVDDVCYSTPSDDVIRFDLNYATGITIFKEFNINLMETFTNTTNIPVCIAPEQSLFTQDFLSSVQKPAIVRHTFWGCYGLGDYTKFSLQDALYHSAFTVDAPYDLFTYDDNSLIQLGNIDGSTASTINLDILVLKSKDYIIDIITDSLSIYKDYNTTITFEYINDKQDNLSSTIQVYDNSSVVFSSTNTASPNSYSIIWNTSTYDFQDHVLRAVITNTKIDGSIETETTYFTPDASSGILDPGLASILAVLFFFFTFTLVAPRLGFNWFGLLITIITIGILSLAPAVWFITFLQSIFAIMGLFTFLIYKDENIGVV